MRLSLIVGKPASGVRIPIVWLGLANLAEHVALLGSLGRESRCRFAMSLSTADQGVDISIFDKRHRSVFGGRVSHLEVGSGQPFAALQAVERNFGQALLALPASTDGYAREMTATTPSIGPVCDIYNTPMLLFRLDFASHTAIRLERLPAEARDAEIRMLEAA
jgi:hypothetical protein